MIQALVKFTVAQFGVSHHTVARFGASSHSRTVWGVISHRKVCGVMSQSHYLGRHLTVTRFGVSNKQTKSFIS